jgi:hypothetical protein
MPAEVDQRDVQLKLRFSEDLRQRLAAAGERNGSSLNSEIIRRLEDSFSFEAVLGGGTTARMLRQLGSLIENAEVSFGRSWTEDYPTYLLVRAAVQDAVPKLLSAYRPPAPNQEELDTALAACVRLEEAIKSLENELAAMMPAVPDVTGLGLLAQLASNGPSSVLAEEERGRRQLSSAPHFENLPEEHRERARALYAELRTKEGELAEANTRAISTVIRDREAQVQAREAADRLVDKLLAARGGTEE